MNPIVNHFTTRRDKNQQQLQTLLQLQAQTQARLNDRAWVFQNFQRAAKVEAAETLDHLAYKWWSQKHDDIPQAQMELVDILHFLLGGLLAQGHLLLAEHTKRQANHTPDQRLVVLCQQGQNHILTQAAIYEALMHTFAQFNSELQNDEETYNALLKEASKLHLPHTLSSSAQKINAAALYYGADENGYVPGNTDDVLLMTELTPEEQEARATLLARADLGQIINRFLADFANESTALQNQQMAFLRSKTHNNTRLTEQATALGHLDACWKEFLMNACDQFMNAKNLPDMLRHWVDMCRLCNMDIDKIHRKFVGKAALNRLRWSRKDYGKDYVKIWDGKEDNVWLDAILQERAEQDLDVDELQNALNDLYLQKTGA